MSDVGHCPDCGTALRVVWDVPVCVHVGCDRHAGTSTTLEGPGTLELCSAPGCRNATTRGVCSRCRAVRAA